MNFVISLKEAEKRRAHIEDEFKVKKIPFSFFDAINKSNLNQEIAKFGISFDNTKLTDGEKACFLSHVALWSHCLENDLKYIAIYEDDVILSKNAEELLIDFSWIPDDVQLIKLEKFDKSILMAFKRTFINNHCLRELKERHLGAAGYILTLSGAKTLLEYVKKNTQDQPVDEILFNININNNFVKAYQILPAIVIQMDRIDSKILPSQLQDDRSKRVVHTRKIKKHFFSKIKLEVLRVFFKTQKLFCKIGFERADK